MNKRNKFYIITGLSGAGKSQALKIMEDFGYFCVDNLPIPLVPKFTDMCLTMKKKLGKVAVGIDVRAGRQSLGLLNSVLSNIRKKGVDYRIVYFNADDKTLIQRYSETRRKHPLGKSVVEGIKKERRLLARILVLADKEIDTSNLTLSELKEVLSKEMNITLVNHINVSVVSFGYKYGIPVDSDIIMDMRFLPNPNYVLGLRFKTGKDNAVKKYVMSQKTTKEFLAKFYDILSFLMPLYVREGKSHVTVSIGCTGGRHRSVVLAEAIMQFLKKAKYNVSIHHRDIDRLRKI